MRTIVLALAMGLVIAPFCRAEEKLSEASQVILETLQEQIKSGLAAISEQEKLAGNDPTQLRFSLALPPQIQVNLGLVLDLERLELGAKVLSVTPGSLASQWPIKPGSHLVAIDGQPLNAANAEELLAELQQTTPGDKLRLQFRVSDQLVDLNPVIDGLYIPAATLQVGKSVDNDEQSDEPSDGCGEVSVFFYPPEVRMLFPVVITKVDGRIINSNKESFRLAPGRHAVEVSPSAVPRRVSESGPSRPMGSQAIEIDVEADQLYYLAAQFDRKYQFSIRAKDKWTPVVWKRGQRECRR